MCRREGGVDWEAKLCQLTVQLVFSPCHELQLESYGN